MHGRLVNAAVGLAAVALLAGCTATASSGDGDGTSKYTQTWSKDYSDTTCDDWNSEMTAHQKFAAAADILSSARDKIDGGTGVAPDPLIESFEDDIDTACVVPTETITDISYGVYTLGADQYKP